MASIKTKVVCCHVLKVILTKENYHMRIESEDCISCGMCVDVCNYEAISANGYCYEIDNDVCIGCGACLEVDCPGDAIK